MKQLYIEEVVLGMAIMAAECGADGVICSPMELDVLSQDIGLRGFPCYTPGIRPLWARKNDQERVTTPSEAVKKGATGIIVGRPILQPPEEIGGPVEAAALIAEEIEAALAEIA
ncbi:orotidine 5'-phosphate decarboxylase [Candidatus Falkowbacteria bacterium]|nr:orotidine 5'-phosphate decarboxylase [Candidatus Falkowbacteria bacterium]